MAMKQLQSLFGNLINDKKFFDLKRLMKQSHTKPAEYSIRIGIKNYLNEKRSIKTRLFLVMTLLEITQTSLDSKTLQQICTLMLELGTPYTLDYFSKSYKIDLQIYQSITDVIQKQYSNYINEGKQVELTKLMEISKVKPLESLVLNGYKIYLEEGNIISFVNLKKRTEIEPKKELILDVLEFYDTKSVSSNNEGEKDKEYWKKRMEKLSKVTGVNLEH